MENTVISFSGGRTSAFMLRRFIDDNGGALPKNIVPIFCNTGKERLETLDFVERCSQRWQVEIVWLEFDNSAMHKFRRVDYASASRNGEPFTELIEKTFMLPNVARRYCTQWLKIVPANRYARHVLGWTPKSGGYENAIGLRADEQRRFRKLSPNPKSTPGEEPIAPLATRGITVEDVMLFWLNERGGVPLKKWLDMPKAERPGWDLELLPDEGNCDLCFLKSKYKLLELMRRRPQDADWWIETERKAIERGKDGSPDLSRFRRNMTYRGMLELSQLPTLFDEYDDGFPDCRCTD
jgi:3'-phosphoadenosine 5'-phosphosulfate sulfotransferase (PAPS reductase)/FAD synthetase